jgi:class 3 adenylate cyclase
VTCSNCGAEAAPGQRFCGNCGQPLESTCPTCGASNAPGQRFCGDCGTNLVATTASANAAPNPADAARAALQRPAAPLPPADGPTETDGNRGNGTGGAGARFGTLGSERRLVSVLFADLVGFTPFSEERDSEDVRETLTKYFDLATDIVTRHGGTVEKFIGDAVMAVWGTPTALEDDAERAVRTALELVDAVSVLGSGIEARAGVMTGETAVTIGAQNQGMVAGDLVNTAARLQSVAAPSTVLVGESTFRAASNAIAFEPAGEQALKGKQAPVPAWRALRVVAQRDGRGRGDALEAPFVGREVELRLLKELYHATGSERRLRHVSIVGSGGIGKSRLAWELAKYLDGVSQLIWWHQGRSPAYGGGLTFWSLGEMVRERAGLLETDDEPTTRAGIAKMLDQHMAGHADRRLVESALLELLGMRQGLSPAELFGAWRTFWEALASTAPVVLMFEDLHWADTGTLDFIEHLMDWSRNEPIFIISLARPELLDRRPDWGAARRSLTSVFLEPLGEPSMRELLHGLVPDLPEATTTAIVERAEGIPLYAVETVRMLVATGKLEQRDDGTVVPTGDLSQLAELAVPETLTALIASRLDALDPADRALALDAAVLGQSFTVAGLAAVAGRSEEELAPRMRLLVRRELLTLIVDPRSPERGQYQFVQALIREVAYNTLARKDRKTRHLAAARWFESLGEPELAGALAGHYLAATALAAPGAEADALATQARIALKAAGDRASDLNVPLQAVTFYEQAISVATDPVDEAELHELAGDRAAQANEFASSEAHFERADALWRRLNNRPALVRTAAARIRALLSGRRMDIAGPLINQALVEFADLLRSPDGLRLRSQAARLEQLLGTYARAVELIDPVLADAELGAENLVLADALVTKGTSLSSLSRFREGVTLVEAGRQLAEASGFHGVHARAVNNILVIQMDSDANQAWDTAKAGVALSRRLGQLNFLHTFVGAASEAGMRLGEWDASLEQLEDSLAESTDQTTKRILIKNILNLLALRGERRDDLYAELMQAEWADPTLERVLVPEAKGFAAIADGDLAEAERLFLEIATDTASPTGFLIPGHLAIWRGDADAALRYRDSIPGGSHRGGTLQLTYEALTAAATGLRGERRAAITQYQAVSERLVARNVVFDDCLLAISMVYAVGLDEPAVAEGVDRARATLTKLGSRPLLDQLDAAIAHGQYTVNGAASSARSEKATPIDAATAQAG